MTGNGQKQPPAEDVHPEQVRCPRRHLPTAEHTIVTQTKNIRLSHRTGNWQKEPPAEDVHPEQARAGICQQLHTRRHLPHSTKTRTTGRGRSPRAKNIRLSHRTGKGQKEPPAEDVHPEQVRCPRNSRNTKNIRLSHRTGRTKNHRQRTFTQSRYAARAGLQRT